MTRKLEEANISGVRVPIQGFVTQGVGATNKGYPPHPFETFSYDQALYDAGIADFNVVPYTSVLPENLETISIDEARAGPSWVHGAVLEVIMAAVGFEYSDGVGSKACCVRRHGNAFIQEALGPVMAGGSMLGLITGVKDKSGNVVGGYAAEYVGLYSSHIGKDNAAKEGTQQLNESIDHELTIRGLEINSGNRSFTDVAYVEVSADSKYAYTLSAIGFTQFSYAPVGS